MTVTDTINNVNPPEVSALRALSELVAQCASIEARIDCMEECVARRRFKDVEDVSLILISETAETFEERAVAVAIAVAAGQH